MAAKPVRRGNATSFGGKAGNKRNTTIPGTGWKPDSFHNRMKLIADRAAEAKRWERLLSDENQDDDTFFKAFDRAADRGYGKPSQGVELTGKDGEPLAPQVWVFGTKEVGF